MTSQTTTGDVKFYLGDIIFFYGTIWFTQTKPCQLYLCNDFHELSTGIKSCFDPTLWTRIESTSFLWKMGDIPARYVIVYQRVPGLIFFKMAEHFRKTCSPIESIQSYPPQIEHRYPNGHAIFERRGIFQGPSFLVSISKFWGVYFK